MPPVFSTLHILAAFETAHELRRDETRNLNFAVQQCRHTLLRFAHLLKDDDIRRFLGIEPVDLAPVGILAQHSAPVRCVFLEFVGSPAQRKLLVGLPAVLFEQVGGRDDEAVEQRADEIDRRPLRLDVEGMVIDGDNPFDIGDK